MKIDLIDDHRLIAHSLKNILLQHEEFTEVNVFHDATEFLSIVRQYSLPDILITDLAMPDMNGIELIKKIRSDYKDQQVKILVLSSVTDVQTIKSCIRAGANGFISKDIGDQEFRTAILEVAAGGQYIAESLRGGLLKSVFVDEQVVRHLTPREQAVLKMVCHGQTIKEIAFDLKLSYHTVLHYHRSVMSKLKVKRVQELIVYAVQHGLYVPDIDTKP